MSRRRMMITLMVLLLCLGLVACTIIAPGNSTSVTWVRTEKRVVALSFDDGPNAPYSDPLLDLLARHQVKATFFLIGERVQQDPEAARRIAQAGHEIGSHSWDGTVLTFKGREFVEEQLRKTDDELEKIGVPRPRLFRAPKIMQSWTVGAVLTSQGRIHVGAEAWAPDWSSKDSQKIASTLLRRTSNGSILVLHIGSDSETGADRSASLAAAGIVIEKLKNEGYKFLTVSELLAAGQTQAWPRKIF